jgi:transcriptional regulator with XRE-family HTH domain
VSDAEAVARFAALLQRHRIARGFSQNGLAKASKVDPAYINRLERGLQGGLPTRKVTQRIARALLLSFADTDRFLHTAGHATQIDWQTAYERLVADLET